MLMHGQHRFHYSLLGGANRTGVELQILRA
jgi:hypothetical protein